MKAYYIILLYCIVLYSIALHCIALYCIVLYCIALYCIVLYCIVLYCIVPFYSSLFYFVNSLRPDFVSFLSCITYHDVTLLYSTVLSCDVISYLLTSLTLHYIRHSTQLDFQHSRRRHLSSSPSSASWRSSSSQPYYSTLSCLPRSYHSLSTQSCNGCIRTYVQYVRIRLIFNIFFSNKK